MRMEGKTVMDASWLFVFTVCAVVSGTLSEADDVSQQSVKMAKPLRSPYYNKSLAQTMMRYSVATYRSKLSLANWSCDVCRSLSSFTYQGEVSNDKYEVRVILGYDAKLRAIVVAFRGTANLENWEENFMAWPVTTSLFGKGGGRVHDGFYQMYLTLRSGLLKELDAMLSYSDYANAQIFVTGHSLGGALATLCALDLRNRHPAWKLTMYNFGSPRVGDNRFVKTYAERVVGSFRVVNSEDPVTKVPPTWLSFRHVPTLVVASDSLSHSLYLGVTTKQAQSVKTVHHSEPSLLR